MVSEREGFREMNMSCKKERIPLHRWLLCAVMLVLAILAGATARGEINNLPVPGTVPVFELSLIYFDPAVTGLVIGTEIELKASLRNEWKRDGESVYLYWGDTLFFDSSGYTNFVNSDPAMKVYFCDYALTNEGRNYVEFETGGFTTLTDAIGTGGHVSTVLVVPSRTNQLGQVREWMVEDNPDVIWSWRPRGVVSAGPTGIGGRNLWYPVVPVRWLKSGLQINQ